MNNLLPLLLLAIPAVGAIVGALLPREARSAARNWALLVSIVTLVVAAVMASRFTLNQQVDLKSPDAMQSSVQMEFGRPLDGSAGDSQYNRIQNIGFAFHLGVDTISLWLILLTALLQPQAVAASFTSITDRTKEYYAWMLMLLAAMLGCFLARDVLLFYIFFELTLIPMFFIIGIWGGPERRYAAGKFFLFTFAGSVFTLASLVYLAMRAGEGSTVSFDIGRIIHFAQTKMSDTERLWVVLGILAGFAVKVPL